jgi:hypothetical protein
VSAEWLKALGQGLHEFRVRHTAEEIAHMFAGEPPESVPGPGISILLRVFVHFHGRRMILLLSGYDKQDDASGKRQGREITAARKYLVAWQQQEARRKAQVRELNSPDSTRPGRGK